MKTLKRLLATALAVAVMLAICLMGTACGGKKVIGVMQFGTHESLNNCYAGILQGLEENGIDTNEYEIMFENSNFDSDAAASQARKFVNSGADIIIGIATPCAMQAAIASNGEIPVVYCAVTDGAVMSSFQNVCGSSDRPNYVKTLELVTAMMEKEDLKIGVISHTSEDSDKVMIDELNAAAKAYAGMEINVKYISEISTIGTVTESLIQEGVDCFVNLLDNTVVGQLATILEKTNEYNIPVFGSEVEQVVSGCVASASIDYIEIGRIAGEMAAKIVLGQDTAANLGNKIISDPTLYYNPDVATKLGVNVPTALLNLISTKDYNK